MKLIYFVIYIFVLWSIGSDKPLTCKDVQIRQKESNIVLQKCSFEQDGNKLYNFDNYSIKIEFIDLFEDVEILSFNNCRFIVPKDLNKYSTSFTFNDDSFDLILSDTIVLAVGKILDPAVFKFRNKTSEKNTTIDYVTMAYWKEIEGKYRRIDHILSIEFDKDTKIITKIRDYPIP